ncbi:MAG TPA: transposase [Gaiella sp.]|nr:transposase [Gaiella sp.]
MGRPTREWIEGSVYHVFARGNNRQAIFLNDGDYVEFDMLLAAAIRKYGLDTFAWSLMPNHWHGIFRCPPGGLSEFMQRLNHRYALRFDRRWRRTAHVFDNRFGAVLQKTEEQFLTTLRYVVRNPFEAGLCASPVDARWTSLRATIGLVSAPEYLRVVEILEHFAHDPSHARERFIAFVVGEVPSKHEPSPEAQLGMVRAAAA